ncbi:hypothetical protein N8590_02960 [bacterium]|nr:hypothetical protein [bacterium]
MSDLMKDLGWTNPSDMRAAILGCYETEECVFVVKDIDERN